MPRGQGSVGGASAATLGAGGLGGGGSQGEPPNAWGPGAGPGPWFLFCEFHQIGAILRISVSYFVILLGE